MVTSTRILRGVAAAALVCQVSAQADTTDCETAYNTADGTANCGGLMVNVLALVCGQGFNQNDCVAKWVNGGGENEWYFFMGAGAGMSGSQLPSACSSLPSGLAMVQYYPDKQECYPAADVSGTKATYKQSFGGLPTSVTLNFAAHQEGGGGTVRNGYLKIACNNASSSGFTTVGDSNEGSYYEVDTIAPCSGAAGPPGGGSGGRHGESDGGAGTGLVIAFFVIGIVYFGGGFVFNMKVKNLVGRERIPHVDFWVGLPGLVKEGARFTKSKVTRTDYAPL